MTGPTLTDAKGLGGVIAQDGFDYQVWDALSRLAAWLRSPAFEGFVIEGLEDVEARFFAPQGPAGHLLDRYQAKSGNLGRADLIEVFTSFRTFDTAHPRVARLQTLVTPQLPATLTWIARDPGRVRRARPFYAPFASVQGASEDKLRADLVGEFGDPLGSLLADSVEIELKPALDRAGAEIAFGAALDQAFPDAEPSPRALRAAFAELSDLASRSRGMMLTRNELFQRLQVSLGVELAPDPRLRLHLRSDRNEPGEDAIEIDASQFSGAGGRFPGSEVWASDLLAPLERTATWARGRGHHRVQVTGSYRLTTAFTVGWALRSAHGFELDIATKSGPWSTDAHPQPSSGPTWEVTAPRGLHRDRLAIAIGVLRNPAADAQQALGVGPETMLVFNLPQALPDGAAAQASVQRIKAEIARVVGQLRPGQIDLFYAGSAAFAVALGHRWNGMPPTQLHEFVAAEQRYVPTARLP